jgi:hypothetical protein
MIAAKPGAVHELARAGATSTVRRAGQRRHRHYRNHDGGGSCEVHAKRGLLSANKGGTSVRSLMDVKGLQLRVCEEWNDD